MEERTTISLNKNTKKDLEDLKICNDETYNSLFERILPRWAQMIKKELEEAEAPPSTNQNDKTDPNI